MVSFTVSSLVALLASTLALAAPTPADTDSTSPARFIIQTVANNGNASFGGKYLVLDHTGAGQNAVAVLPKRKDAAVFQVIDGYLVAPIDGEPKTFYTMTFVNQRPQKAVSHDGKTKIVPATPAAYHYVDDNIGGKPPKGFTRQGSFSYGAPKGVEPLQFERAESFNWVSFAVCSINSHAYPIPSGDIFLWRSLGSKADKSGQCADVGLKAIFI